MLRVTLRQHSEKGRKEINQDFHGACIPGEPQLSAKGIALALADGVSSSAVSHVASEAAVKSFLEDYFCTSPAWSVKKSVQRVLMATNSWLHAQTRQSQHRYDIDRGYVCTLSAIVFKSTTAHLFHVGDSRIYRLRDAALEQLTDDHRLWVSQEKSYLSRALGVNPQLEIDYRAVPVEQGDTFVLTTDGVHELVSAQFIAQAIHTDLEAAPKLITTEAYNRGSTDNLTVQIVRIEEIPSRDAGETQQRATELPVPPLLQPRMLFDGYKIMRELHASSRRS